MLKRLLALGACALVMGASARYFSRPTPAVANVVTDASTPTLTLTSSEHLRWETVWTQSAPHLTDVAITPNGSSVAWVDDAGSIRRIETSSHRTLWQTESFPGINSVCLSSQGTVLAYSRLNPGCTTVRILDAQLGQRKSVLLPVQGAVWSAAITPDGTQALVGTGNSLLYSFPLRNDAVFPGAPASLPGIPETMDVTVRDAGTRDHGKETVAFLGTWQEGGVGLWGLDHHLRWQHEETVPDYSYNVTLSQDGSTAVAVASRGPRHESARLHVWDMSSGDVVFIEDLHGFAPKVSISANGQQIAVSYSRADGQEDGLAPGGNGNIERKVTLFDRRGRRMFEEKGGVFFAPELVGLSADGTRLMVRDPRGTVWTLDNRGRTIARLTGQGGQLLRTLTTPDGKYLLLYRSDGTLTLYRATFSV